MLAGANCMPEAIANSLATFLGSNTSWYRTPQGASLHTCRVSRVLPEPEGPMIILKVLLHSSSCPPDPSQPALISCTMGIKPLYNKHVHDHILCMTTFPEFTCSRIKWYLCRYAWLVHKIEGFLDMVIADWLSSSIAVGA